MGGGLESYSGKYTSVPVGLRLTVALLTVGKAAHYAPTLLLQFGSFVRGGDWKCRA